MIYKASAPFISMDVDAVIVGILITFLGALLLLEQVGIITQAALQMSLPWVLIVVGLLVTYVGYAKDKITR